MPKNLPVEKIEKYAELIGDIKQRICPAQYSTLKTVNRELIGLYCDNCDSPVMRASYLTYALSEKLSPLVTEIGWSHNLVILAKCKDDLERGSVSAGLANLFIK